jgi:PAS domain S-box-containing protein
MNFSEEGYKDIFNLSPIAKLILGVDSSAYTILDVNNAYLQATNTTRAALVGKSVFTAFPSNPSDHDSKNIERTVHSFEQAVETKKPHTMEKYRYDIPRQDGDGFTEKYWTTINTPVLGQNGEVRFIIHSPRDITELFYLEKRERAGIEALKNQRKQLYSTFMQAPVGIGIFKGPEFTVELINAHLCEIYGKTLEQLIGKPIFEILTFAKGQGFEEKLNHVRTTGEAFKGFGIEIPLIRKGLLEKVYVDFVYEPFYEEEGIISGVIVVATEVTAKVKAMHQLEEAEERARLAADAVDLGVFDLNILNGEIVTSQRFANHFGFKEPVSRTEYVTAFHPDDLSMRKKAHEQAIENGILDYEARVIWPDRSIHWLRVEGKVIYDRKNNPVRMLGTVLDFTKQKWSNEEQRKLITLVDNSVDSMAIYNLEGRYTYINAAGIALLGLTSLENAISLPTSDSHNQKEFESVDQQILPEVIRDGSWSGKMMMRNYATGEIFPVFTNCIRIDDTSTGNIIAIGAVMRDLRPEISAKQALADNEQLLRNITTAAPTALWMSNKRGEITYINQTWVDWSGNTLEENLKYGWMRVILPEDLKQMVERFQSALHLQLQYEIEFRINHVDGSPHWCTAMGHPQYNEHGDFTGYIGSCTDITEYKELQNQKDNFIGIASHELKTPVTSIKGYTQVLQRILEKKGLETEAGMMRKMDDQLNRLTNLIGDLLDVTKINAGKLQLNEQFFDIQPLITELVVDLQRTTQKHRLITNFKPTAKAFADKDRIEQVVINLITNAIKYSPNTADIIIHCEQVNNNIVVGVQDFGVGIAHDNKLRVFEQFYRISGEMQHTFPGLGLGLYISAEIIKRAGGKIWVESKENEGSCFYFSLPVQH